MNERYRLARGAQVREEDFGLLFYSKNGPRLYFLSTGDLLDSRFFTGEYTLSEWMARHPQRSPGTEQQRTRVEKMLQELALKGVILEC